jgi:hypothetical protein
VNIDTCTKVQVKKWQPKSERAGDRAEFTFAVAEAGEFAHTAVLKRFNTGYLRCGWPKRVPVTSGIPARACASHEQ